jgi:hypothetical protein
MTLALLVDASIASTKSSARRPQYGSKLCIPSLPLSDEASLGQPLVNRESKMLVEISVDG